MVAKESRQNNLVAAGFTLPRPVALELCAKAHTASLFGVSGDPLLDRQTGLNYVARNLNTGSRQGYKRMFRYSWPVSPYWLKVPDSPYQQSYLASSMRNPTTPSHSHRGASYQSSFSWRDRPARPFRGHSTSMSLFVDGAAQATFIL